MGCVLGRHDVREEVQSILTIVLQEKEEQNQFKYVCGSVYTCYNVVNCLVQWYIVLYQTLMAV